MIEITRQLLQFLATGKLLKKTISELGERGDGIVRDICVPLESRSLKAEAETLAYTCFTCSHGMVAVNISCLYDAM